MFLQTQWQVHMLRGYGVNKQALTLESLSIITDKTSYQVLCLCLWFRASLTCINNCPTRCNTKQSIYYSASSLYMFRVSTTTIIGGAQNCNYSLRYCAATSLQRGQAWPRWREVAAQKIWPVPEAVVTVLCTPDDRCGWHPKHVEWTCRIINRLLCVASRWTIINITQIRYSANPNYLIVKHTLCNYVARRIARSRLRYCATSRKVAGSIPDSINVILYWRNPSVRTMALDSASNRKDYQEYFLGGKGGRCVGLTPYHLHVCIAVLCILFQCVVLCTVCV